MMISGVSKHSARRCGERGGDLRIIREWENPRTLVPWKRNKWRYSEVNIFKHIFLSKKRNWQTLYKICRVQMWKTLKRCTVSINRIVVKWTILFQFNGATYVGCDILNKWSNKNFKMLENGIWGLMVEFFLWEAKHVDKHCYYCTTPPRAKNHTQMMWMSAAPSGAFFKWTLFSGEEWAEGTNPIFYRGKGFCWAEI